MIAGLSIVILLLTVALVYTIIQHWHWYLEKQQISNSIDPLALIGSDYRIIKVNQPFADTFGCSPQKLRGEKCHRIFENRESPCPGCMLEHCLASRKSQLLSGYLWQHEGFKIYYDIAFHFVAIQRKPVVLEIKRDVSSLHNTRIRLEEQKQQLEFRTQELAVKNRALTAARNELIESLEEKNHDLELARELQMSLLPEGTPQLNGAKFWVHYAPVHKVGGDIYDFLQLGDHRLGIFLGDVAGHGIAAAVIAALARMSLYNNIRRSDSPRFLFRAMNQDLRSQLKTGRYLTALFGVLDLKSNLFTYVRASHPPPVILHTSGKLEKLEAKGMLLGILPDPAFIQETVQLQPGDRLFFFTDGCFDFSAQERNRLSYARFLELVQEYGSLPLDAVYGAIALRLRQFTEAPQGLEDDKTFIAMEIGKTMLAERYRYLLHFSAQDTIVRAHLRDSERLDDLVASVLAKLESFAYSARQVLGISHSIREIIQGVLASGSATIAWSVTEIEFKMSVSGKNIERPQELNAISRDAKAQALFMVRTYMDEVFFDESGRTITILKRHN
jgi:phosphoserine phosphatase RsbU/P